MSTNRVILARPTYDRLPAVRSSTRTLEKSCNPRKRLQGDSPAQTNVSSKKEGVCEGNPLGVPRTPSNSLFLGTSRNAHARERTHEDPPCPDDKHAHLLAQLLELSDKERKELLDRLTLAKMQSKQTTERDRDVAMWVESVYSRLVAVSRGYGAAGVGIVVVKRLLTAPSAWAPVADFMHAAKFDSAQVVERQAVYNLLAELLVSYTQNIARHTGAPFSAKMTANCTTHISSLVEAAFPGYARAGLLSLVVLRLRAASKKN